MPSLFEIGPPVSEKIFEGFLPYMGMAVSEEMFEYYGNIHV